MTQTATSRGRRRADRWRHRGRIYPLTGSEAITRADQLATIGLAIGPDLTFHEHPVRRLRRPSGFEPPAPVVLDSA